jgi:hypothetical protein
MTKILQPPDLKSIIQPILDRLDFLERQPARALEIRDMSGNVRIRSGISPQTNDLAAYDASGNLIWDTTGLVGVGKILNQGSSGATVGPLANTPTITTTGIAISFTVARTPPAGQANVLLLSTACFFLSVGGTSTYGRLYLGTDTVSNISQRSVVSNGNFSGAAVTANTSPILPLSLGAGTYTASLYYSVPDGTSVFNVASWSIIALQLGA